MKIIQLKSFLIGFTACFLLLGTAGYAVASTGGTQIEVFFKSLHYVFEGTAKTPLPDQKGFIYNGTTYIPLRFIGEALDKDVQWDGMTDTISVKTKTMESTPSLNTIPPTATPDTSATSSDNISLSAFSFISAENDLPGLLSLNKWTKQNTASSKIFHIGSQTYSNGLGVYVHNTVPPTWRKDGGIITYDLKGQYKRLTGVIGIDRNKLTYLDIIATGTFKVVADGNEVFSATDLQEGKDPANVDIDVTNVKMLKLYFNSDRVNLLNMVFGDAKLTK
ncbi:NPCBM/NEW2 domain-containing protein [Paenibacillus baimaensis]|uniref:NPCBM/NEW2 domain-containing protein n=1 Tax=Paenibacillus baimaensis TaxID=2982185 RepID=UPI0021D2A56A|nr:NPCBM/NEW2 domain-containing protein [Paenibacillus sp. WQ 127069]